MSYLLHCTALSPSINFSFWWLTRLLCRTDHTTHHTPHTTHTIFSLHQPPTTLASYFLSFPLAAFVLFHLSTQRGYAHAKGIKHIDFGRGSVCFLRKERDEKTLTWGCLTHSQVFPLTWMRDWECLFKYLSFLFTHLFFFPSNTHTPHPFSLVHFMLSITHTYPFAFFSLFFFYLFINLIFWFIFSRKRGKENKKTKNRVLGFWFFVIDMGVAERPHVGLSDTKACFSPLPLFLLSFLVLPFLSSSWDKEVSCIWVLVFFVTCIYIFSFSYSFSSF